MMVQQQLPWEFTRSRYGYIYTLPNGHLRIKITDQLLYSRRWWHTLKWLYHTIVGHIYDPELQVCRGYLVRAGFFVGQVCPSCLHVVFGPPVNDQNDKYEETKEKA